MAHEVLLGSAVPEITVNSDYHRKTSMYADDFHESQTNSGLVK